MIKIIIDVFSGDDPKALIRGTAAAVNVYPDVKVIMPGDPTYLERELALCDYDTKRLEILPASEVIGNDESPTTAIRQKKDSSLVRGATLLRTDPEVGGMISAGSTGAILCCGIFVVGRMRGIDRPALAPVLPTVDGGNMCLIDCGANADCRSEYLAQFALLGTGLMRSLCGVKDPRVALVNVGAEDHKGNMLTAQTAKLLAEMPVNFVGNMEAREALSGKYDVLVCDGFVGNVLLKSIEGTAAYAVSEMAETLRRKLPGEENAQIIDAAAREVMRRYDYNSYGGAYLLGCRKPIEKIHGAANERTIPYAVGLMRSMILSGMTDKISEQLDAMSRA